MPTRHTHKWDGLHRRHLLESTHTHTNKQTQSLRMSALSVVSTLYYMPLVSNETAKNEGLLLSASHMVAGFSHMVAEDLSLPHSSACKQLSEHKAVDAYRAAIKIGRGFVGGLAFGLACQTPCTSPRRSPRQPRKPATEESPPRLRHSKSAPQNIDAQGFVEAVPVASKSVPENMDAIAERLSQMDADASAMLVVCPTPTQGHAGGLFLHDLEDAVGDDLEAYVERANSGRVLTPQANPPTPIHVSREMPTGWEQAWLDPATADSGLSDDSGSRRQLPVCVFISSMAGDRKITKDCQWVLDLLRNKRVPFEVVDLADQPGARQRMAQLSGDEQSLLPQVQFRGESVGIDRLKDLEDHYELGPKLRTVIRRYAAGLSLLQDGNSPSRRASFPPPPPFGRTATATASSPVAADVVAAAEAAAAEAAAAGAAVQGSGSATGSADYMLRDPPRAPRDITDRARRETTRFVYLPGLQQARCRLLS